MRERNMVRALVLAWVFGGLAGGSGSSMPKTIRTAVDWPSFLARSDPVNTFQISAPHTVPDVWLEGSFAGNGMLGAQLLVCPGGICHQSLLLGNSTRAPDQSRPHQAVIPLARGDVSDIRTGSDAVTCNPTAPPPYNTCGISGRIARPRFGIGDLVLTGSSPIIRGKIRTHLHNATITARLTTAKGELSFSLYVHARRQLVVVDALRGSGGEAGAPLAWEFRPAPALPPGLFKELPGGAFTGAPPPANYTPNPDPICTPSSCRQALVASAEGRGWATAWRAGTGDHESQRLLVAVTCDLPRPVVQPKTVRALAEASAALSTATTMGASALAAEHTVWWAEYYWSSAAGSSGSFLTLPAAAAKLEQFHWIQVFKVGAENACRRFLDSGYSSPADAGYKDNCILLDGINGPLSVSKTKWSNAIWDMNVQGSQWASLSINMIEQARALVLRIPEQLPNLIATVPPHMRNDSAAIAGGTGSLSFVADCAIQDCAFPVCLNATTVPDLPCMVHSTPLPPGGRKYPKGFVFGSNFYGGLPWICHSIWLVYRHTLEDSILEDLVPLLKRATTFYLRTATRGVDGKLHLPTMFSPEYANAADLSFDHALFRWCLRTSIHIATKLSPASSTSTEVMRWRTALEMLSAPLVDPKTGSLMIGAGVPFHSANKHFSHLFSMFPLGLLDWNVPAQRELWTRSLGLFAHYNDPTVSAEGFTYLGMSLITMLATPSLPGGAPVAWADAALGNITHHFFGVPQLGAGTMYADHAACGPMAGCRQGMAGACNESPIMASLALQHMLLQSWNSKPLAIFPSMPQAWTEARFHNMRAEGSVLVSAAWENATTIWFSLNATKGGNLTVYTSITDLDTDGSHALHITSLIRSGVYNIVAPDVQPWAAVFFSKSRGPPSKQDLTMSPLPLGPTNLWGSRGPPLPPPPPPPRPLPHCPAAGCPGCGGCHWPYENATQPLPSRPFLKELESATTLACEAQCAAEAVCIGFTQRGTTCWLYAHISGQFSHRSASVSWHPNPKARRASLVGI